MEDTLDQFEGVLCMPLTSENSLVYSSGSRNGKEFKPICTYIQSLDKSYSLSETFLSVSKSL